MVQVYNKPNLIDHLYLFVSILKISIVSSNAIYEKPFYPNPLVGSLFLKFELISPLPASAIFAEGCYAKLFTSGYDSILCTKWDCF